MRAGFSVIRPFCWGGFLLRFHDAVQKSVADQWKAVTGVTLLEAYGLTETSPTAERPPVDGLASTLVVRR